LVSTLRVEAGFYKNQKNALNMFRGACRRITHHHHRCCIRHSPCNPLSSPPSVLSLLL